MPSRLRYREVGRKGQHYPKWLRELDGKSGAYVIRSKSGKVLYVGESHSGRLYGTITRHFQTWGRNVNKWDLYWGRETGKVYNRGDVRVAVQVTRSQAAANLQDALIKRLDPRDNEVGKDEEEVPF